MATAQFAVLAIAIVLSSQQQDASTLNASDIKGVFVEDDWLLRRSYRLEDFLWSGSGDGSSEPASSPWLTTTVFRTTTIVATILTTPVYHPGPQPSPVWPMPSGGINPTPVLKPDVTTYFFPSLDVDTTNMVNASEPETPDQRYWLVTVIVANASLANDTMELETRLASIYKVAFSRKSVTLGLTTELLRARCNHVSAEHSKASAFTSTTCPYVVVCSLPTGEREMELLYWVRVAGRPVLAQAAAADMRLVTDSEVAAKLGHRVLTKAEPYLKTWEPLNGGVHMSRARDTWLLVAAAVSAVCLLLLLVALVALGLGKRKRRRELGAANQAREFDREQEAGVSNLGYTNEEPDAKLKSRRASPMKPVAGATVSFQGERSSSASSAGSSQTSLVRRRPAPHQSGRRRGHADQPKPKPRRRQHPQGSSLIKKVQSEMDEVSQDPAVDGSMEDLVEPTQGSSRKDTAQSPTSLLSMPSVKSFPRGAAIPEPLSRVLAPAVVPTPRPTPGKRLTRHGSMEGADPGVVGPIVWDMHRTQVASQQRAAKRLEEREAEDQAAAEASASNLGRMRRRFNELVDDAFSLFGSRSVSPESSSPPPSVGHRGHSAIVRPVGSPLVLDEPPRPRTSDYKRPVTAGVSGPRGAWGTREPSLRSAQSTTLPRPLSAGPFHRPPITVDRPLVVQRDIVLVDGELAPSDPAVPLIAAIKEELRKFHGSHPVPTLPGTAVSKP